MTTTPDCKLYLDLSPDLARVLAGQSLDFFELIRRSAPDAAVYFDTLPPLRDTHMRSKDLVPLIMVSAVGLSGVLLAITHLLNTIFNRPLVVECLEYEPMLDGQTPLHDPDGNTLYRVVRRHDITRSSTTQQSATLDFRIDSSCIILRIGQASGDTSSTTAST